MLIYTDIPHLYPESEPAMRRLIVPFVILGACVALLIACIGFLFNSFVEWREDAKAERERQENAPVLASDLYITPYNDGRIRVDLPLPHGVRSGDLKVAPVDTDGTTEYSVEIMRFTRDEKTYVCVGMRACPKGSVRETYSITVYPDRDSAPEPRWSTLCPRTETQTMMIAGVDRPFVSCKPDEVIPVVMQALVVRDGNSYYLLEVVSGKEGGTFGKRFFRSFEPV